MISKDELQRQVEVLVDNLEHNHSFIVTPKRYNYDGDRPESRVVDVNLVRAKLHQLMNEIKVQEMYD